MLHILWLIIKWILILLGILIGLIFLILLLLLFCPIRYRGKLKKDRTDSLREIHATGEVSWLLHIISAQVFWEQGVLKTKICFLGIPLEKLKNLFRKKREPRALSNSGNQNAKKQTESSRSHEKTSKSEQQNDAAELQMSEPQEDTVEDINEISEKVIMEPISISEEISEDEKKLRTKIADLILNIVGKIKTAVGKLIRIIHNFLGIPKRILKKIQSLALTIRNFCDKTRLGVVVEHTAADIVDDAVEVIGHGKAARDLDVGAQDLQQRSRKNIIGMEFSAVGKAFCRDFHGFLLFIRFRLLQMQGMIRCPVQSLPHKHAVLQRHIAAGAVFLGDRDRAGVEIQVVTAELLPRGDMGVAVQQNIPRLQRRQVGRVVPVAVGGVDEPLPRCEHGIVGQNGEFQHHLPSAGRSHRRRTT